MFEDMVRNIAVVLLLEQRSSPENDLQILEVARARIRSFGDFWDSAEGQRWHDLLVRPLQSHVLAFPLQS